MCSLHSWPSNYILSRLSRPLFPLSLHPFSSTPHAVVSTLHTSSAAAQHEASDLSVSVSQSLALLSCVSCSLLLPPLSSLFFATIRRHPLQGLRLSACLPLSSLSLAPSLRLSPSLTCVSCSISLPHRLTVFLCASRVSSLSVREPVLAAVRMKAACEVRHVAAARSGPGRA